MRIKRFCEQATKVERVFSLLLCLLIVNSGPVQIAQATSVDTLSTGGFADVFDYFPLQENIILDTVFSISGNAGVAGATLSYTDGSPLTATADENGNYSFMVSNNWSGTVTPSKTGYSFTPIDITYSNVISDQIDQNYIATAITPLISGNAGVAGAILSYTDGSPKNATADGSGNYSFTVSYDWSGIVTPSKTGYTFTPSDITYSNVTSDQTDQNYVATAITPTISGNTGVADATLNYTDGSPKTATADSSGNYSFTVSYGWSGTVTPSRTGYTFTPSDITYSNVTSDQTDQNYIATAITPTISGNTGIADAILSYTDGSPKTVTADGDGNYSFTVSYDWSGTVTPSKTGYTFSPTNKIYSSVTSNQDNQNYVATTITPEISGNAGVAGATLSYTDSISKTATADGSGNYSFTVSYDWSGTVTPTKNGYTFSPINIIYANVTADQTEQDYIATVIPPPSAEFDAFPTTINAQSTVEFHLVNTDNLTTCTWDYGDGTEPGASCDPYHEHTYSEPGFYTVSLSVMGPGGSDSLSRPNYITVHPTLTVNKTGNGTGTVTSSPAGINCGSDCSGNFGHQAVVTLTAIASSGSAFTGWSGGGCSGTGACTVTMTTAITVSAHFEIVVASCPAITGWKGEYWANTTLSGAPAVCQSDTDLNFNWGTSSPDPLLAADGFSARWTKTVNFNAGTYRFHMGHDDGARLFIDDMVNPVLDKWATCCTIDQADPINLSQGNHVIRVEYFENSGAASAQLWWEKTGPSVTSITRTDFSPTSAVQVHFIVMFSEPVSGVNTKAPFNDFTLTTMGVTNASITEVSRVSNMTYIVTVNTGLEDGMLRLDVADDDTIKDAANKSLGGIGIGNGNFINGESYDVVKVILQTTLSSNPHDGWALESAESSGTGGTMNKAALLLRVGDDAANKQYRSILSFDTSGLPDNGVITSAILRFKYSGITGTLPFNTHGNLLADIRKGFFKDNPTLEIGDFNASASKGKVLVFTNNLINDWYSQALNLSDLRYVNAKGFTQFRLRFSKDDNNDFGADFLNIFSGNAAEVDRPQLVIEYYIP